MTGSAARSAARRLTGSTTPAVSARGHRSENTRHTGRRHSPWRQRMALSAVAAILAGCAGCAVLPPSHPTHTRARPAPTRTRPAGPAQDVSALLPVTPAQLEAAAALAARFAAAYDTHRPGERPSTWLARLAPMATSQLNGALTRAATTPALPQQWVQTAAGHAVAEQVRDLTAASVIFTVRVRDTITSGTGPSARLDAFAVTVTSHNSGSWAVYDIEPAAAGDAGGVSAGQ